jgi:DNA uptake protein ComE-like DNA-binding protein
MPFKFKPSVFLLGALLGAASLVPAAQAPTPAPVPAPAAPKAKAAKVKPAKAKPAAKSTDKMVDLNNASKAELLRLPGIDAPMADKIIAGRPYMSKSKVLTQNVIPMMNYQMIRAQIFVAPVKPIKK